MNFVKQMKGLWDKFNAESKSSTCEKYVKVPDFLAEEGSEGSDTLAKEMDCDMDAFLAELALWCGDDDHSSLVICMMPPADIVEETFERNFCKIRLKDVKIVSKSSNFCSKSEKLRHQVAMCTADPDLCKHKHEEFCMAHPDGPGCERWITCPDMKLFLEELKIWCEEEPDHELC
jgi:hypothetical protein